MREVYKIIHTLEGTSLYTKFYTNARKFMSTSFLLPLENKSRCFSAPNVSLLKNPYKKISGFLSTFFFHYSFYDFYPDTKNPNGKKIGCFSYDISDLYHKCSPLLPPSLQRLFVKNPSVKNIQRFLSHQMIRTENLYRVFSSLRLTRKCTHGETPFFPSQKFTRVFFPHRMTTTKNIHVYGQKITCAFVSASPPKIIHSESDLFLLHRKI